MYQPAEDSFLLANQVKLFLSKLKNKDLKVLDMGTGSGIQAKTCLEFVKKENLLLVDLDKDVVKKLKNKFHIIHSNLFSKVQGKFDLIIFNPPYLPEDKNEPIESKVATTAGKEGYELIIKFLKTAKPHLTKTGVILLLFSSLSKPSIIKAKAKELGYSFKLLKRQKLFFEELFVYEFYF